MASKQLRSPDGRTLIWATDGEVDGRPDEVAELLEQGYTAPSANRRVPERANSGLRGHQLARASSTTEGQERNTGSTTDLSHVDEGAFEAEVERRVKARLAQAEKERAEREQVAEEDDDDDDDSDDEPPVAPKTPAAAPARPAAGQRPSAQKPATKQQP